MIIKYHLSNFCLAGGRLPVERSAQVYFTFTLQFSAFLQYSKNWKILCLSFFLLKVDMYCFISLMIIQNAPIINKVSKKFTKKRVFILYKLLHYHEIKNITTSFFSMLLQQLELTPPRLETLSMVLMPTINQLVNN